MKLNDLMTIVSNVIELAENSVIFYINVINMLHTYEKSFFVPYWIRTFMINVSLSCLIHQIHRYD